MMHDQMLTGARHHFSRAITQQQMLQPSSLVDWLLSQQIQPGSISAVILALSMLGCDTHTRIQQAGSTRRSFMPQIGMMTSWLARTRPLLPGAA